MAPQMRPICDRQCVCLKRNKIPARQSTVAIQQRILYPARSIALVLTLCNSPGRLRPAVIAVFVQSVIKFADRASGAVA